MKKHLIKSVEISYYVTGECHFDIHFHFLRSFRVPSIDWFLFINEHDRVLAEFIFQKNYKLNIDIVFFLGDIGFPFEDKLQEYVDFVWARYRNFE